MASAGELCSVCYAGALQLQQGLLVCEVCGTQSQEFVETQEELPEGQAPNTARRIKQKSKRSTKERETIPAASLTGATCTQLVMGYALLWQRMLKRQVAILQKMLQIGPELPDVARQLWTATLRLSALLEDATIRQLGGEQGFEERPDKRKIHLIIKAQLPPVTTLQICFLAAWILRSPLLPRDIVTMVASGALPFLDVASHAEGIELHPRDVDGYRPAGVPGANSLCHQACELANALGLQIPVANVPALAHRFLADLELPQELADVMQLLSDLHLAPHGRLCLSETTSSRSHKGADMMYNQTQHRHLDIRDTPLRNPHLNIMAVLVIAARLVWGLEGFHEGNHLLLRETPRFPGGFPPPPAWQAWAHRVVRRQLTPYLAPEQAAKADDAELAAWMKRVRDTTMTKASAAPDSLQTAIDLLDPQAQAFWQRSEHPAGPSSPVASPASPAPDPAQPADPQALAQHGQEQRKRGQQPPQHLPDFVPGMYHLCGIAATEPAIMGHPDYVCLLTAACAYLGCLPRHLHYSVCCIEQEMADVERALGTGQRL